MRIKLVVVDYTYMIHNLFCVAQMHISLGNAASKPVMGSHVALPGFLPL